MQALSISKSLSEARSSAEKGQVNCKELRDLVIQAISESGGRVDYVEVSVLERTCFTALAFLIALNFKTPILKEQNLCFTSFFLY